VGPFWCWLRVRQGQGGPTLVPGAWPGTAFLEAAKLEGVNEQGEGGSGGCRGQGPALGQERVMMVWAWTWGRRGLGTQMFCGLPYPL
jgi:hypothetical protein